MMKIDELLNIIHCELQEIQNEFKISDDNEHLNLSFKIIEDFRDEQKAIQENIKYLNGIVRKLESNIRVSDNVIISDIKNYIKKLEGNTNE